MNATRTTSMLLAFALVTVCVAALALPAVAANGGCDCQGADSPSVCEATASALALTVAPLPDAQPVILLADVAYFVHTAPPPRPSEPQARPLPPRSPPSV